MRYWCSQAGRKITSCYHTECNTVKKRKISSQNISSKNEIKLICPDGKTEKENK